MVAAANKNKKDKLVIKKDPPRAEPKVLSCPKCAQELQNFLFKGVVVDKCFGCGGFFLDRGELEKLVGDEDGVLKAILGYNL